MRRQPTEESGQLAKAIDHLFQLPLEQFVAERNALASSLRKTGRRDEADRAKALEKPSATAWAVNQVWWTDRARFEAMLTAGARLRDAHQALRDGKAPDLRALIEARQAAVNALAEAAVGTLGGPAEVSPVMRDRIVGTFEAIATSGVPGSAVLGRLTSDLRSTGLDVLSALAGSLGGAKTAVERAPAAAGPRLVRGARSGASRAHDKNASSQEAAPEAEARARRAEEAKAADAKAALTAAHAALKEAESGALEAINTEAAAKATLASASTRIKELETALDGARDEERAARRAAAEAARAASSAEFARAQALRAMQSAEQRLSEIDAS